MKQQSSLKTKKTPSVSIIIPSHRKYPHYKKDELVLKKMINEVDVRMKGVYDRKVVDDVLLSLNNMKAKIDYKHLQEGIVIHYSPLKEKIYHLSFKPEEKLIIGDSFEIGDVLYNMKRKISYFILVLSENLVRVINVWDGKSEELEIAEMPLGKDDTGGKGSSRIKSYSSGSKTQNVTDKKKYDERKIDKYLKDIDSIIKKHPVLMNQSFVVCAPVRLIGKFNKLTKNKEKIIGYLKGNFDRKTKKEVILETDKIISKIHNESDKRILAAVEKESKRKRLSWGVGDINRAAQTNRGHLLVVEKDFIERTSKSGNKNPAINKNTNTVSNIIETVLENGGDVEFVEKGKLADYGKMVMITRY